MVERVNNLSIIRTENQASGDAAKSVQPGPPQASQAASTAIAHVPGGGTIPVNITPGKLSDRANFMAISQKLGDIHTGKPSGPAPIMSRSISSEAPEESFYSDPETKRSAAHSLCGTRPVSGLASLRGMNSVEIKEGFVNFKSDKQAECVLSHVCLSNGIVTMSREFHSSLENLSKLSLLGFQRVSSAINNAGTDEKLANDRVLIKFVRYEVYKTVENHCQTHDEDKQNLKLAETFLQKYSMEHSDDGVFAGLLNMTRNQVASHVMCRCIYSDALTALVSRSHFEGHAGNRTELGDRFRFEKLDERILHFKTNMGSTHSPKEIYKVLYDKTMSLEEVRKFTGTTNDNSDKNTKIEFQFVPYDTGTHVFAKIKVPIIRENVKIEIDLNTAQDAPKTKEYVLKILDKKKTELDAAQKNFKQDDKASALSSEIKTMISAVRDQGKLLMSWGTGPEKIFNVPDSTESAGIYRRSPNSQRVIEIGYPSAEPSPATLQFKGVGVPAFGFNHDSVTDKSGGEYFDPGGDMEMIVFHQFSEALGTKSDVTLLGNAYVLNKACNPPSGHDEAGRAGGVSIRLDLAAGYRLSDLVKNPNTRGHQAPRDPGENQHRLMFELGVMKTAPSADRESRKEELEAITASVRNYALCNMLGLVYNDTSVAQLLDTGARGSFSDSGSIAAASTLQTEPVYFFGGGGKGKLDKYLNDIDGKTSLIQIYRDMMVASIDELKNFVGTQLSEQSDKDRQLLSKFNTTVSRMTGFIQNLKSENITTELFAWTKTLSEAPRGKADDASIEYGLNSYAQRMFATSLPEYIEHFANATVLFLGERGDHRS